jgi:hypothetical protein
MDGEAVDSENAGSDDIEDWNENEEGSVSIASTDSEGEDCEEVGSDDDVEEGRSENKAGSAYDE